MGITSVVLLVVLVVVTVYFIVVYRELVAVKQRIAAAWQHLEAIVRQRHDELRKLLATCRQSARFEHDTLGRVLQARANVFGACIQGHIVALGEAESELRTALRRLFASAEAYPDLQNDDGFLQLRGRISGLDAEIARRRESYNEAVNANNARVEEFPGLIVAALFSFKPMPLLRFSAHAAPEVAGVRQLSRA